jgi:hypothetical protein
MMKMAWNSRSQQVFTFGFRGMVKDYLSRGDISSKIPRVGPPFRFVRSSSGPMGPLQDFGGLLI